MKHNINASRQGKPINYDKHIWEGWTVGDFIEHLEMSFTCQSKHLKTREDVAKWTASEQPYYKKRIPEVIEHFCQALGL